MSLARGKFGIEYNPKRMEPGSSGFGWVFAVVALAILVLGIWTFVSRVRTHAAEAELLEATGVAETPPSPDASKPSSSQALKPSNFPTSETFRSFQPLKAELARRPPKLRNLLMRLEEAEKRRDIEMAVSTIESIRALPGSPAADLDDSLARRLGALNLQGLFDLRSAQWVKTVTVGRGDSASRIAAENGSTFASLARLNGGTEKVEKILIGQKLYVMNHPRFNLVFHKRARTADLSLNGKFFKRYDLTSVPKAKEGAYEMPEKRRLFGQGVGACLRAEDRQELDMLLPKGSPILVSEL